jgi:hypothetical protein
MKRYPGRGAEHLFNPLNIKLNPICHMLALLGAHHILHVSRIRVNVTNLNKYNENVTNAMMYGIMLPVEGLCTYNTQFFYSCHEQAMKEATPYI